LPPARLTMSSVTLTMGCKHWLVICIGKYEMLSHKVSSLLVPHDYDATDKEDRFPCDRVNTICNDENGANYTLDDEYVPLIEPWPNWVLSNRRGLMQFIVFFAFFYVTSHLIRMPFFTMVDRRKTRPSLLRVMKFTRNLLRIILCCHIISGYSEIVRMRGGHTLSVLAYTIRRIVSHENLKTKLVLFTHHQQRRFFVDHDGR
jgi:hypothetical protein